MENDVAEAIETAASTNNEGNKDPIVAVEIVDIVGGGDGDEGAVITRFRTCRPVPIQQQKSTSDHVVEAIDTAAPTINEGNEDPIVPVYIVVEEEGFEDRDGVERNDDQ